MKDSQAFVTPLGVSGTSIELDSLEWFDWLSKRSSFSYQSAISDYTCNKRSNGKWYASKRKGDRSQGSKTLAQEYLGAGDKVTKVKLEEIARKFALPDRDYWYLKHPKPTKPTEAPGAGCTDEGTTNREVSSQNADEIADLKAQIAELENQGEELLNLQDENMRLQDENAKLKQKFEGLPEMEKEMREEINRLMSLQLENDSLKSWNRELRERLEANPSPEKLIQQYETDYETIKKSLPKPPKDLTRNWVEFWRFKTWLESR